MYQDFDFQSKHPVAQWHNGARSNKDIGGVKYTGGWLLPVTDLPAGTKVNSTWKGPVEWTFESGAAEQVYTAGEVFVALLRRRRRWFGSNDAGATVYYTNEQARGRHDLRSHTQVLCAALGVSVPIVLSVKGERSRALDRALSEFYCKVILPVNEATGDSMPLYSYWVKIGSTVSVAGDEGFITVGSGKATKVVALPAVILPEAIDEAYLQKAAVPEELGTRCARWQEEAEPWSKEWQYNPNPVGGHDETVDPDTGEVIPY